MMLMFNLGLRENILDERALRFDMEGRDAAVPELAALPRLEGRGRSFEKDLKKPMWRRDSGAGA